MRKLVVLCILVLLATSMSAKNEPPVKIRVSPRISFQPADVTAYVTIVPNEHNAYLVYVIGAETVGDVQASVVKIDPRDNSNIFYIKGIPKGRFYVKVFLYRDNKKPYAMSKTTFEVVGGDYEAGG